MIGVKFETADMRVAFWQRLLVDESISPEDVDDELLALAKASSQEEKSAYVLLRAVVVANQEMSDAMRRNLKAAILYWFSQTGTSVGDGGEVGADPSRLETVIGRQLAWADCARSVGGNPADYSAYTRLLDRLRHAIRAEWFRAFGAPQRPLEETS